MIESLPPETICHSQWFATCHSLSMSHAAHEFKPHGTFFHNQQTAVIAQQTTVCSCHMWPSARTTVHKITGECRTLILSQTVVHITSCVQKFGYIYIYYNVNFNCSPKQHKSLVPQHATQNIHLLNGVKETASVYVHYQSHIHGDLSNAAIMSCLLPSDQLAEAITHKGSSDNWTKRVYCVRLSVVIMHVYMYTWERFL